MSEALTTGEIAKYCGVNFRTVLRWIERGYLRAFQLPGRGDNRVEVREFVRFLREHDMPIPEEFANQARNEADTCRILIVDDDLSMANAVRRTLKSLNHEIKIAGDGFEAGVLLATFLPHLMVLDLAMPGMDGFQVLEFIRSEPQFASIKVLVLSGMSQADLDEARDRGADRVMAKPFDNDALEEAVATLLADRNPGE
ncbi:MAG: response regulator [Gammaproteobacteria bacterium]|nr:MAG: response regulator [Gammaproteobacteria bacterium]